MNHGEVRVERVGASLGGASPVLVDRRGLRLGDFIGRSVFWVLSPTVEDEFFHIDDFDALDLLTGDVVDGVRERSSGLEELAYYHVVLRGGSLRLLQLVRISLLLKLGFEEFEGDSLRARPVVHCEILGEVYQVELAMIEVKNLWVLLLISIQICERERERKKKKK